MKLSIHLFFIGLTVLILLFSKHIYGQIFPDPDGDAGTLSNKTKSIGECDYQAETSGLVRESNTTNRRLTYLVSFNSDTYQSWGAVKGLNKENCDLLEDCNPGWAKVGRIAFKTGFGQWNNHKLHVGWKPDPYYDYKIDLAAYYHDYNSTVPDFHVAHRLTHSFTNTAIGVDMFLGNEIIALIINNYALGIRKPSWYTGSAASRFKRTFYYGDPAKECEISPGNMSDGVFALDKKYAYFTNMSHDDDNFLTEFNDVDYMTWNLTEFKNDDDEEFFSGIEIHGSISDPGLVSHGSIGTGEIFEKQMCIIPSGANISFQAGDKIYLHKGFHAQVGSSFHASICPPIKIIARPSSLDSLHFIVSNTSFAQLFTFMIKGSDTTKIEELQGLIHENSVCFYPNIPKSKESFEIKYIAIFSNECQVVEIVDYFNLFNNKWSLIDPLSVKNKRKNINLQHINLSHKSNKSFNSQLNKYNSYISSYIVYPNPTNDLLNIKLQNNEIINEVYLLDGFGKLLFFENSIKNTFFTININDFSPGIYFIKIVSNKSIYSHKISKL